LVVFIGVNKQGWTNGNGVLVLLVRPLDIDRAVLQTTGFWNR